MSLAWPQVGDLADLGGRITEEDLRGYRVQWQQPLKVTPIITPWIPYTWYRVQVDLLASNLTLVTVPPPGSGAVLAAILNIMQVPALHYLVSVVRIIKSQHCRTTPT